MALTDEQVCRIAERTEGWPAGLQLAVLSLMGSGSVEEFLRAFTGSHRHVADYLMEEVLLQQPAEVQSFPLETSCLDRLTAPLCDAVTGRSDGQTMLDRPERAHLFLVPLDDDRCWYRYHPFFRDLLQLEHARANTVQRLYVRASGWLEQPPLLSRRMAADAKTWFPSTSK